MSGENSARFDGVVIGAGGAVIWAAFELAKLDEMALEALRGISAPMGKVSPEV